MNKIGKKRFLRRKIRPNNKTLAVKKDKIGDTKNNVSLYFKRGNIYIN